MPRAHWHTDPTATAGRKQRAPRLQSSSDERSVPSVTWPTGHSSHPVAPTASWYWLDPQGEQGAFPVLLQWPFLHWHGAAEASGAKEPIAQGEQGMRPVLLQ